MNDAPLSKPFRFWIIITVTLAIVVYVHGILSPNPFPEARTVPLTTMGMNMLKHYFGLSLAVELALLYPLYKNSWVTARPIVIIMIVSSLLYILIDIGFYLQGLVADPNTILAANALKLMLLVAYSIFLVTHDRRVS